jgi:hypothetical protein
MIIARQQLDKQLFASAGDNNMESIAKQQRGKQSSSTIQIVFCVGSAKMVIKEANSDASS